MSSRATLLLGFSLGMGALLVTLARTAQHRVISLRDSGIMDLNCARRAELEKLHLDALAIDRIIENRPYRNKLELLSRMIIPKALYGRIRHQIGVRSGASSAISHAKAA
jgi:hypothetical protein